MSHSLPEKQNLYVYGREGRKRKYGGGEHGGRKEEREGGDEEGEGREREIYLIIFHSQGCRIKPMARWLEPKEIRATPVKY